MNSSGYIRGYMSKNMNAEDFIEVVRKAISREFEEEVLLDRSDDGFKIAMATYSVKMRMELIEELKSPYRLDRYILEQFEKQGFLLDYNRSGYINYCFGNFSGADSIINR